MKRRTQSLEAIAYHEAGHAVMAFITRRRILVVSINPTEGTLGHIRTAKLGEKTCNEIETRSEFDLKIRARVEAEIMGIYAGPIAQSLFQGGRINMRDAASDFDNLADLLMHVCDPDEEAQAYGEWLSQRTKRLLKQPFHWAAVETLARELLQRRHIGGRKARQITYP